MEKVADIRPPQEIVQTGLRILARIIAREVANGRLAEIEVLESDFSSLDALPAEVSKHV